MAIVVITHPPERAVRAMPLICGGCCCCCCCCIHTAGGVIGAMVGNTGPNQPLAEAVQAPSTKPEIKVYAAYWRTTGILSLITLVLGLGIFGIAIIMLALPLIQFLASMIVAVRLGLGDQPSTKWRELVRITGFSIAGTVIGTIVTIMLMFGLK